MRVLIVHNGYRQTGGEDAVFAAEAALLRAAGHHVETVLASNDDIGGIGSRATTAMLAAYRPSGRRLVATAIAAARPDVVHVHNFFPLLSAAVFDACRAARVPAVWTLHNFRSTCAGGMLHRAGLPCEKCVAGSAAWGAWHRCYRGSAAGSVAVAAMIGAHRALGTWHSKVARFVALSAFARGRLIAAGLPATRIAVKPNFVADPDAAEAGDRAGLLFVGRLSREKGVHTLIAAARLLDDPLTIIGDGPERIALERAAPANVRFAGWQEPAKVQAAMRNAAALVVPSEWYEPCPLVAIEAMALGTPVIAARIGSLPEMIADGESGRLFAPRDPTALAATASRMLSDRSALATMGRAARRRYEMHFSPAVNLAMLTGIYREAIAAHLPAPAPTRRMAEPA